MTQESLFDAAAYVRRAYDQLVLAYEREASQELESLKWQTLQTWLSLQEARISEPFPFDHAEIDNTAL